MALQRRTLTATELILNLGTTGYTRERYCDLSIAQLTELLKEKLKEYEAIQKLITKKLKDAGRNTSGNANI